MSYSNYPGGFAQGITIRNLPLVLTNPGQVFWVYNGTALQKGQRGGSDSNKGTYDSPFSTIDYAVGQCTAGRGDIIFVKPGHAETISSAAFIALDVAGITIVGLGKGNARPTLTWSTAASTITVAANDITIHNFLCIGSMATTFTVTAFSNANAVVANNFTIDSCEFRDQDATHGFIALVTSGTTANQGDGLTFTNNKVYRNLTSPPAANTAVIVGAAMDRLTFGNNFISNKAANNNIALGIALGANAVQNAQIYGNRTYSLNTGTTAGELFSGSATTCSGLVYDNYSWHLAATGLLAPTGTKLGFVENYCSITGAADKSALINPSAV